MSGDRHVATTIASLKEDVAVKKCLQKLFTHELNNADMKMPSYTKEYESAIAEFAPAWSPSTEETGD